MAVENGPFVVVLPTKSDDRYVSLPEGTKWSQQRDGGFGVSPWDMQWRTSTWLGPIFLPRVPGLPGMG